MKISYKGAKKDFPAKLQEKLDARFAKLSKLLEKSGERGAHVVLTTERRLAKAEVTIQYYDHQLVGIGSDADQFTALISALDKLEKQATKQRAKWRDGGRRKAAGSKVKSTAKEPVLAGVMATAGMRNGVLAQRVFRVVEHDSKKPMTLDEAVLEMDKDQDYVVYRDASKNGLSVLVRRRDGHFDLIEG